MDVKPHVHWLQHVPFEGLGCIESWLVKHQMHVSTTAFWKGEYSLTSNLSDLLIVMGGPMNIYEEHKFPWLLDEKKYIEAHLKAGKKVLGVCLGAQLIADVLGSRIYAAREKEIGWFPVAKTQGQTSLHSVFPERWDTFHWHGETFDLPDGAVNILKSEVCPHQCFVWQEQAVGVQFHLEMTPGSVEDIVQNCADELVEAPFIQSAENMRSELRFYSRNHEILEKLLQWLVTTE